MTTIDPGIRFPGESEEYRRERNRLLEAEVSLRRAIEQVAAQRRGLPPGGLVPDDYRFEEVPDGSEVRFSELFEPGKDTLVIYSFMFPGTRAIRGPDLRRARPRGSRYPRPRARRARRSWTHSTAPRPTSPSG